MNVSITTTTPASVLINCSDTFVSINGICTPLCVKMKYYSNAVSEVEFVIQIMAAFVAIVSSILLVISSYVRRKTM